MLKPIHDNEPFDAAEWCAGITTTGCSQCGKETTFHISYWYAGMVCAECSVRAKFPEIFEKKQHEYFDDYVTLPKRNKKQPAAAAAPRKSVTVEPTHIKPLIDGMQTANICVICGNPFETTRKHSKTCGSKCRKALSRRVNS